MTNDFVSIDKTKQFGLTTVWLADVFIEIRKAIDKLHTSAGHQTDGTTFTTMESKFGLSSGDGTEVLDMLTDLKSIFNSSDTISGADRLAKIDNFVGRVAGQ